MNETLRMLRTRRSVREFSNRQVDRKDLELILDAAQNSPSAHGKKSWHIAVFENRELRDRIAGRMPWFGPVQRASAGILILGNPEVGVQKEYWPQDCASLAAHILIAAGAMGLGTTWCGVYPVEHNMEAVRAELEIPEPLVPFCMIGVGYPLRPDAFRERDREGDAGRISWNPDWIRVGGMKLR